MPDSHFLNKQLFMKKHFLAFIAAGSLLAACNSGTETSSTASDSTSTVNALMSAPPEGEAPADGGAPAGDAGGEAPAPSTPTTASSSFMAKADAQAIINNYDNNSLANLTTKYYLADLQQLNQYIDHAIAQDGKDAQIILARKEDGQVTIVITAVKPDGTHILYNNGAVPSVLEHCLPCPPGTDCYTSTNLSQ